MLRIFLSIDAVAGVRVRQQPPPPPSPRVGLSSECGCGYAGAYYNSSAGVHDIPRANGMIIRLSLHGALSGRYFLAVPMILHDIAYGREVGQSVLGLCALTALLVACFRGRPESFRVSPSKINWE